MPHPNKKHHWPTRWNANRNRYEVKIKGQWVSIQRASVVRRKAEAR